VVPAASPSSPSIRLKALIKESFPGLITLTAATGAAGLELAQTEEPDIILLNVVLHGMDGFEVCQNLKSDPKTRDIPVVFLTASREEKRNRIHALEVGAEAFLAKPIDETELIVQIRAMLKIKSANDQKRNEIERLAQLVAEQTRDLQRSNITTLNLLEDLREENEGRKKNEEALRKSEERYHTLFEHAAVGVALVETQTGHIFDINQKFCDFLGFSKEEMLKLTFKAITHADDVQENVDKMALLLVGKIREYSLEKRYIRKNGSIMWGYLTATPLWLPGNEPADHYHIAVVEDITERKRVEEQIQRSETWLRGLVRILQYHPDTTQEFLDNALSEAIQLTESKIGYIYFYQEDRKQFVLNTWSKEVMKECSIRDPQTTYALEKTGFWGEAVRQRKPIILNDFQADHPLKKGTPEGHANLTRFMSVPVFNGDQIVAVVGLANKAVDYDETDVLQLTLMMDAIWKSVDIKKAGEALHKNEDLYRSLFNNMLNGLAYCQMLYEDNVPRDFIYLEVNKEFEIITGLINVVGKRVSEAIPGIQETDPELIKTYGRVALTGNAEIFEIYIEALKDWYSISVYSPEKGYFVSVFDVITTRKLAEEKLDATHTELQRMLIEADESRQVLLSAVEDQKIAEEKLSLLNVELEQRVQVRTAQLEATNKELEAFSYSVSHDLRAPLRGIDGWSLALLEDYRDQLDENGRQHIDRVRSETQRMGQLIDDLMRLSRLTRMEMKFGVVNLSDLAQVIASRMQNENPQRQIEFVIQSGMIARGDLNLLEIVLTNLLSNANKFTGKQPLPRIEFGNASIDGKPAYFIRDNGAGFDMAFAKKLFGAFQRMHKQTEFPGTGIGLATVQRIIHRHGGKVWAEAQKNQGATFYFTLEEAE
jgi:PAS domain S-box-containing protein